MHPALAKGTVAVVTGGASGIGLAAVCHLAAAGTRICIVDLAGPALDAACAEAMAAGAAKQDVIAVAAHVSNVAQLHALADHDGYTAGYNEGRTARMQERLTCTC